VKKFLVAIDQGTTSTRAILFDVKGNLKFKSQFEFINKLPQWGLPVNTLIKKGFGVNFILSYYQSMEEKRQSLDYDIDGVVFKVNSFDFQNRLGERSRSPRWAIAGKLKAEQN